MLQIRKIRIGYQGQEIKINCEQKRWTEATEKAKPKQIGSKNLIRNCTGNRREGSPPVQAVVVFFFFFFWGLIFTTALYT